MFSSSLLADNTSHDGALITKFRYDGNGENLYFQTNGRWDAGDCDPIYIWVKPSVKGQKEILSIGLAAKMGKQKVWFSGSCSNDPNYFEAHYISVH